MPGATRVPFVRVIAVILLLGFAAWVYLGNFELLFNSHAFMTGADFVDEKVTLPLRWLLIVAALAALPLVWLSKFKQAVVLVAVMFYPSIARAGTRSTPSMFGRTRSRSNGLTSSATSRRRPRRLGSIATRTESPLRRPVRVLLIPFRMRPCWLMFGSGTCAHTTQPSRRFRRCGLTTLFLTPTLIAIS